MLFLGDMILRGEFPTIQNPTNASQLLHTRGIRVTSWGSVIPTGFPDAYYACCICFNISNTRHIAITAGFAYNETSKANIFIGFCETGDTFIWNEV